ncbi:MAG: DUF5605 domain-containing protein, partial [Oscillospiraceae bacterium]|nr:DUF5605 domain-containing protein [Oscillospiraceae bacterium]
SGGFTVTPPKEGDPGPVRAVNGYHFAYADNTPFYPMGTTCYAWTHQPPRLQEQTLEELKKGYFNKIRFCVFPKHYVYNLKEPQTYPYEGTAMDSSKLTPENFNDYNDNHGENNWDFMRFNPEHFRRFENRIADLAELGIEADIIVMHPYDRWGFSNMGEKNDDLYWKYIVARFAAFSNVWWSFANEFDLMPHKTIADWERYAEILCESDPYNHLRSIHNGAVLYDHTKPWVTHCSLQRHDVERITEWRDQYKKPAVIDEMGYEGNIPHGWGNLTAVELVRRFWEVAVRGGYNGHGETYLHPDDILWWSHGGKLHGESPERIRFLLDILKQTPGHGLKQYRPEDESFTRIFSGGGTVAIPEQPMPEGSYYLVYFGNERPDFFECNLDDSADCEVEVIDTWDMTITNAGVMRDKIRVELPGKEYMAVRIRKA